MKLLLADDHTLFRDALVQYITRANADAIVTLAKDFHEAYAILKIAPDQDLVLLDLRMPGMNGMDGFEKIRTDFPDTPVALMSGVAESKDVSRAIELGAAGYFPKTLSGKGLLQGIERVLQGEVYVPSEKVNKIMPSYYADTPKSAQISEVRPSNNDDTQERLTPRELDVLEYLVTGAANKDIADALGLQVVTIKLHVRGICRKLGAKNRTQAAMIAQESNILKNAATGGK